MASEITLLVIGLEVEKKIAERAFHFGLHFHAGNFHGRFNKIDGFTLLADICEVTLKLVPLFDVHFYGCGLSLLVLNIMYLKFHASKIITLSHIQLSIFMYFSENVLFVRSLN